MRVINFLQAFEENSPFTAYKTALFESQKVIGVRFTSSAGILPICQNGRHEVKY